MASNFFEQQDNARRLTRRLLVVFFVAVVAIILTIYAVVSVVAVQQAARSSRQNLRGPYAQAAAPRADWLDLSRLGIVATAVLVVVSSGSLYKIVTLRDGGEAIARMLGGRQINMASASAADRRLLNVVEEMALASGTPVPPVYVLDDEPGINAFAAGFTPGDAVVAVSRGCLDHLTRDELQGVVGHEFSHILNGDMRLNLRLMGLIHGILVIALIGQLVFRLTLQSGSGRSSSRDDNKDSGAGLVMALLVVSGVLFLVGSIGVLVGRLIKCAISRQREFLADASSVQFTRNPDGIAGALKKIGGLAEGSRIQNANAEQACHMFFGQGVAFAHLLATHPPLEERIHRLDPSFDGRFAPIASDEVVPADELEEDEDASASASGLAGRRGGPRPIPHAMHRPAQADAGIPLTPDAVTASVGRPTQAHVDYASSLIAGLPELLAMAVREPFSARAVVYALLIDEDPEVRSAQIEQLRSNSERGTVEAIARLMPFIDHLNEDARLPLVDLTFPALRQLSLAQYQGFRANVDALVKADQRVSLFEYALQRMLLRHLDRAFYRVEPPRVKYHDLSRVFDDCNVLLSTLARLGHPHGEAVDRAHALGMSRLQGRQAELLPADQCSLGSVERALNRLVEGSPSIKRQVVDACAACIAADGVVTPSEGELLRAIADSLDCPIPPLLARRP